MSPQNRRKICRVCLVTCDSSEVIDKNTKDDLDLLLLQMNLFVSEEPVICKNCTKIVRKCCDFKSKCVGTHDNIVSFASDENNAKMDLKNIYLRKKEDIVDIPEDYNICGFCMSLVNSGSAIRLDNEDEDNKLQEIILPKCLPELDLSIIEKPIICSPCYGSLKDYFHLITNSTIVEETIKKYCESQDIIYDKCLIDLTNVLQFILENVSTSKDDDAVDIVKKEIFCLDQENVDRLVDEKNETLLKVEDKIAGIIKTEGEFYAKQANEVVENIEHVKMEDHKFLHVDIKTEQQDFDRFQDELVKPDNCTSTHENSHLPRLRDPIEKPMYQCESCSYQTKYRGHINEHVLVHKNRSEVTTYQCASCLFETKHKRYLKSHMLIHRDSSEVTMYQCETCSFQAKYKKSVLKHTRRMHKNEMKIYRCETCSFETKYKESLNRHFLVHKESSEIDMYQCVFCSFQTKYKNGLKMHSLIHTDSSEVTIYQCDSCPYQTKKKFALKMHSLVHKDSSEVTMYQCDSCSYQAKRKYALEMHKLIHKDSSEVTMYKCDCCSYTTKHKRCLKRHLLSHKDSSQVPMYQCEFCSYQTKFKGDITRHLLTHKNRSGVKLYRSDFVPHANS